MNSNNSKKSNAKRLFMFGSVLDVDNTSQQNMNDLLEQTFGQPVPFRYSRNGNNSIEIEVAFGLTDWGNIPPDTIPVPICKEILGQDPPYPVPNFGWGGYFNDNLYSPDFADLYRLTAKYYGASRVKDINVTVNPQSVTIKVNWR